MHLKSYGFYKGTLVASETKPRKKFSYIQICRSMVNSPHKGQWRGALMFDLICTWINDWVNNREAGELRCHRPHYDAIVMQIRETSHFLRKSMFLVLRSGCSGLNGLIQWQMMTSFVASPGHRHLHYCNKVIRSVYNHSKRSEGLAIESPTSTRLCLMILFIFCSYLCCLSMGGSYNFRLCFELKNVTPGQHNIAPRIQSWCDEAKKYSWLFLFFQLRRLYNSYTDPLKMLMVVDHMPFFSWVYERSTFVKRYVTAVYQCVYDNSIAIMLRIVYLAEPPYGIIYVYWYRSPTGDTYAIVLFPMF